MGNTEYNFCENSNLCNIFPIKNNNIRKSNSMVITNNIKDSTIRAHLSNRTEKESIVKSRNNNSSKYFLLNPNSINNNTEIKHKMKKPILKDLHNKNKQIISRNDSILNLNKKKVLFITDLKRSPTDKFKNILKKEYKKEKDLDNKNEEDNWELKMNLSSEENTIINNSYEDNSTNSLNESSKGNNVINNIKNKNKNNNIDDSNLIKNISITNNSDNKNENNNNIIKNENIIINNNNNIDSTNITKNENIVISNNNDNKNNIVNTNIIKNENIIINNNIENKNKIKNENIMESSEMNKISEIREIKESDEFSGVQNEFTEKQIELYEKSLNSEKPKPKEKKYPKDLIKGLKINNFRYSQKTLIETRNFRKNHTIKESKKAKLNENSESGRQVKKKLKQITSSHSIPQTRHLDPDHPLNFLIIKRQIKSSLYPLNKKSFNIITYKEDNSKQYGYFELGNINGITKYIISDKNKIIFEGEFENGFPKGYGKYSIGNEGRYYEGIFNKEIVLGIETWKDGTIYMGEFKNNKKDGIGMYRWPDGTTYYGEWKNNNMEGFCYIKFADDRRYEGQMINGVKNGYGEFTWKPIRKYIGNYVNDLKDGFGIYIWNIKAFQIYVGFWHKGKMEGIGLMINGDKISYGKWYRGEKIKSYKNKKELKSKYNSIKFIMASNLINHRKMINLENDNNIKKISKKTVNVFDKKDYHNEAKVQLEKCINFMCNDFNQIKSTITKIFIKTNETLGQKQNQK